MDSSENRRSSGPSIAERWCEHGGLAAAAGPLQHMDPPADAADALGMARGVGTERCGDSSSASLKVGDPEGLRGAGAAKAPLVCC